MTRSDALRILNLGNDCSPEQVRQAYLDLVKVWHPDRFQEDQRLHDKAVRALQDINDAYSLLRDDSPTNGNGGPASDAREREAADGRFSSAAPNVPPPAPAKSGDSLVRLVLAGVAAGLVVVTAAALLWPGLFRSSAVAVLAPGPGDLPEAAASSAPTAANRQPRITRPQSGTELLGAHRTGGGSLVVSNASGRDAVVALATASTQERAVYVRAGEQITVVNVAAGTYGVLMTVGHDWTRDGFLRDAAFMQLDQPVEFAERGDRDGTEYTRLTVKLQPVVADMQGIRAAAPFHIGSR